jgi:hypothetical protein
MARAQISYFVENYNAYLAVKAEAEALCLTVSQLARERVFPTIAPPNFNSFLDVMALFAKNLRGLAPGKFFVAECLPDNWKQFNIGFKAKIGIPFNHLVKSGLVPGVKCIGKIGSVTTYVKE